MDTSGRYSASHWQIDASLVSFQKMKWLLDQI